ncbi:MAG: shikimate kinase [Pseudomonadota bacterium]
MQDRSNIVLIGMPGSGKTTIGKLLAEHTNKQFIDGDQLLEEASKLDLQDIVDLRGLDYFRALEEDVLGNLDCQESVIATGGSAVYSAKAMHALKKHGVVVYLYISLATMLERVKNQDSRGLVKKPGTTLESLYQEREALYPQFAEVTIDNNQPVTAESIESMVTAISN